MNVSKAITYLSLVCYHIYAILPKGTIMMWRYNNDYTDGENHNGDNYDQHNHNHGNNGNDDHYNDRHFHIMVDLRQTILEKLPGGSLPIQCDISNNELFLNVLVNRLYFGWDPQITYSFYTIATKGNLCFCFVTNCPANRSIFYLYKGTNIANFVLWKSSINWMLSGRICAITVMS